MEMSHQIASISLELASHLADLAVEEAINMGVKIHVNVVDTAGNVVVYKRMPGVPLPAREFSEQKAYTAANFKMPTSKWKTALAEKPFVANGLAQHDKVALFGGGAPIEIDGAVIGAIGVAGALEEQDVEIADKVVASI